MSSIEALYPFPPVPSTAYLRPHSLIKLLMIQTQTYFVFLSSRRCSYRVLDVQKAESVPKWGLSIGVPTYSIAQSKSSGNLGDSDHSINRLLLSLTTSLAGKNGDVRRLAYEGAVSRTSK
jgi:hypothetical protein